MKTGVAADNASLAPVAGVKRKLDNDASAHGGEKKKTMEANPG